MFERLRDRSCVCVLLWVGGKKAFVLRVLWCGVCACVCAYACACAGAIVCVLCV